MRKKNDYLISIIIPVHNAEKCLSCCLSSIICQSYKNIEIIIVNDGSTDQSGRICKQYEEKDDRVSNLTCKTNRGVSFARNLGLQKACGDYIIFVDSDDELLPKCVESCVDIIKKTGADIVKYSYYRKNKLFKIKYKYSCAVNRLIKKEEYQYEIYPFVFTTFDFTSVCMSCINASVAKKNLFKNYIFGEDFLFSIDSIICSRNIYVINKPLYLYRMNNSSATHTFNEEVQFRKLQDIVSVCKDINRRIAQNDTVVEKRIASSFNSVAATYALNCNKKIYNSYIKKMREYLDKNIDLPEQILYSNSDYDRIRRKKYLKNKLKGLIR